MRTPTLRAHVIQAAASAHGDGGARRARGQVGLGVLCCTRLSWWVRRGLKSWVWLGAIQAMCDVKRRSPLVRLT